METYLFVSFFRYHLIKKHTGVTLQRYSCFYLHFTFRFFMKKNNKRIVIDYKYILIILNDYPHVVRLYVLDLKSVL